jgi:hypothetical protein
VSQLLLIIITMKKLRITKRTLSKFISGITTIALVLITSFGPHLVADAASFTSSKDTSTRLKISALADHTVVFTLPTAIDFDSTGNIDTIHIDFPSTFATSGTWLASEFTLNDGTARTSVTPSQGAGTIDCTVAAGVNNFCVAIDTTNFIFTIKPSSTWTASATAATVTFTIAGSTGNGTLTNPASVAATNIDFQLCDEVTLCISAFTISHSSQVAYGIADDDQVNVTATVGSSITFDLDASTSNSNTNTPYNVALGALTTAAASNSDNSGINSIWVDLDTNAVSAVVTVVSANAALKSTAVPGDTIPSATGTMAPATANYGLCVGSVTQTSGGALAKASPFNGATCTSGHVNTVGLVTTSPTNILTTPAPIAGGRSEIRVNAENSLATVAHNDYTDTLTFIATGTF